MHFQFESKTLILLGLMVPLSSAILKQVSGRDLVVESITSVALQNGYTVSRVQKLPAAGGVQRIEVTVDSTEPVTQSVVNALAATAQENSKRAVRLSVITRLVRDAATQ